MLFCYFSSSSCYVVLLYVVLLSCGVDGVIVLCCRGVVLLQCYDAMVLRCCCVVVVFSVGLCSYVFIMLWC